MNGGCLFIANMSLDRHSRRNPCAKIGKILDTEGGNGKKVRKEAQFYSLHTEKWTSMPLRELQFKTMNYAFIRSA